MVEITEILEERGSRYGSFAEHARLVQEFKFIAESSNSWKKLRPYQKESFEMVFHKLGRILNGDPDYIDSYLDVIGYIQLVVNELEKLNEKEL